MTDKCLSVFVVDATADTADSVITSVSTNGAATTGASNVSSDNTVLSVTALEDTDISPATDATAPPMLALATDTAALPVSATVTTSPPLLSAAVTVEPPVLAPPVLVAVTTAPPLSAAVTETLSTVMSIPETDTSPVSLSAIDKLATADSPAVPESPQIVTAPSSISSPSEVSADVSNEQIAVDPSAVATTIPLVRTGDTPLHIKPQLLTQPTDTQLTHADTVDTVSKLLAATTDTVSENGDDRLGNSDINQSSTAEPAALSLTETAAAVIGSSETTTETTAETVSDEVQTLVFYCHSTLMTL